MDRNLKLCLISFMVSAGIMVGWSSLAAFFRGPGVNFVGLLAMLVIVCYLFAADSYVRTRIGDLFTVLVVFVVLELISFFLTEFGWLPNDALFGARTYQTIISIVALLYFAYTAFRFIYEACNLRFGFIETILGNGGNRKVKQAKTRKEFANGSLEDKPNNMRKTTEANTSETEGEE